MSVQSTYDDQTTVRGPNPDVLRRAAFGEIDHVEMESIAAHLSICQGCWQTIENYAQHDPQLVPLKCRAENKFLNPHLASNNPIPMGIPIADSKAFRSEFHIIQKLGRGGSGEVFQCFDKRLNRSVAVKILRSDHLTPEKIRRIQHEARLQAKINHPNFVQIFEVGETAGVP